MEFTQHTLDDLLRQLEDARSALRARQLSEQHAWRLLGEVETRRRDAKGTAYEGTMDVVTDLVQTLWRVTHARDSALRQIEAPPPR